MLVPFSTLLYWGQPEKEENTCTATRSHALGLLHLRAILNIGVEHVQLLVALHNLTALIDPQQRVFDLLPAGGRFVHAHVYRQLVLSRLCLDAYDKLTVLHRLGQLDGFIGRAAEVIGGFWQEEGLCAGGNGFCHHRLALLQIVGHARSGADLADLEGRLAV